MELEYKRVGDVDCITASGTPKEMAALVLELQGRRTESVIVKEDPLEGQTVGQRIKAARKSAGLTQQELGEKLGLSFQAIAQWDRGVRNAKVSTLQKIADVLGCSATYLAFGIKESGSTDVPVPQQDQATHSQR